MVGRHNHPRRGGVGGRRRAPPPRPAKYVRARRKWRPARRLSGGRVPDAEPVVLFEQPTGARRAQPDLRGGGGVVGEGPPVAPLSARTAAQRGLSRRTANRAGPFNSPPREPCRFPN
jgi:hypothetical protein